MKMNGLMRPLSYLVAALLAAGGGAIALGSNKDDSHYEVTAYFEKAIGLFDNSDVMILGVPVGKITKVDPQGTQVRVDMKIAKEFKVPADAFAQIVPISVIADRYVQLAPVYEGGPALEDGAILELDRTQIPAELDDVFRQLKKLLDAIEPGREGEPGALGELIVQLDETLAGNEEDLKGTLINAAELTSTLADSSDHLSGLLVNLERLFAKLATRSNAIGDLNTNFASVMAALVESREDLEGTLANLGRLTVEVADVLNEHGDRLDKDLNLAAHITSAVVENRASVEEALSWLPVVGIGLKNAYHPDPIKAVDVRDNAAAKLQCEVLDVLPDSPIKDALQAECDALTGEPPPTQTVASKNADSFDCGLGVKKVKRQLRRLSKITLPIEVTDELVKPLRKRIRLLKRRCDDLGKLLTKPGALLEEILPNIGNIPLDIDGAIENLDDLDNQLTGAAAGPQPIPPVDSTNVLDRIGSWFGGFLRFVGFGS